jgi:hypothetical protein
MAEGSEFKLPVPLSKLSDEVEHTDELRQKHYQPAYLHRTHQLHPEESVKTLRPRNLRTASCRV